MEGTSMPSVQTILRTPAVPDASASVDAARHAYLDAWRRSCAVSPALRNTAHDEANATASAVRQIAELSR